MPYSISRIKHEKLRGPCYNRETKREKEKERNVVRARELEGGRENQSFKVVIAIFTHLSM